MQRRWIAIAALGWVALSTTASAQTPPDPEQQDKACGAAVQNLAREMGKQTAKGAGKQSGQLQADFQGMRNGCAELRRCKKECRQAKRGCKKGARADKKDCKADCKSLKGKAKRDCKRSCRADKKVDKKACKAEKKECKSGCREAHLTPACRGSRNKFWNGIGKILQSAADAAVKSQGNNVTSACQSLYTK